MRRKWKIAEFLKGYSGLNQEKEELLDRQGRGGKPKRS
jgi:hypothetical protein